MPKLQNSTDRGQKLISSEGGQDTSACKISGHFLHAFSRKWLETPIKIVPKLEKSTDCGHKLISSEDGQDTSACKLSGHFLHAFSGKCPETSPDGRTDGKTDGRTDGRLWRIWSQLPWSKLHRILASFLSSSYKVIFGRTDGHAVTVGRVDQQTHVQVKRGYFRLWTDGRTTRKHNASGA